MAGSQTIETIDNNARNTTTKLDAKLKSEKVLGFCSIADIIGACVYGLLLGLILCLAFFVPRRHSKSR